VPPSQVLTSVILRPITDSEWFMRTVYVNILSVLLTICVQVDEIVSLICVYANMCDCGYYKQKICNMNTVEGLSEALFLCPTVTEKVKLFLCMS
jgi:hypothetical protein